MNLRGGALRVKHLLKFSSIEAKEFRIKLDDLSSRGSILITERVNDRFFHVSLEPQRTWWLMCQLQALLANNSQRFFRKFRSGSYNV